MMLTPIALIAPQTVAPMGMVAVFGPLGMLAPVVLAVGLAVVVGRLLGDRRVDAADVVLPGSTEPSFRAAA